MALDKKPLRELVGRLVVTKEGKRLGMVKDISFETRTGELLQLLLKDVTSYTKLKPISCILFLVRKSF